MRKTIISAHCRKSRKRYVERLILGAQNLFAKQSDASEHHIQKRLYYFYPSLYKYIFKGKKCVLSNARYEDEQRLATKSFPQTRVR